MPIASLIQPDCVSETEKELCSIQIERLEL